MRLIFRVVSPSLKKTPGQSFCAVKEFENKIALVFSKLIVSLLIRHVPTSYFF